MEMMRELETVCETKDITEAVQFVRGLKDRVKTLEHALDQWRKLAEMLIELRSDEFPAGGEAMIDLERDAMDLYGKIKEWKEDLTHESTHPRTS